MTEQGISAEPTQQQFAIEKIFVKDISFESPAAPQVFTQKWEPEVNLQLNSNARGIGENHFEVILGLTVTVTNAGQTAYLAEIQQCGIFVMSGFQQEELGPMLGSFCPNILFPYGREAIADMSTRGGFPPLHLAPVNFDALYAQHVQQQTQENTAAESSAKH